MPAGHLGLSTGVGLVVANMIGAGVLLSAGFMVQEMSAGVLLLAWVLGIFLAICGTLAYGALARVSGRSGGEYRYLRDYMHPVFGCLAGAGSLVLGFAAPIAVDALAIGAYARALGLDLDGRIVGTFVVLGMAGLHASGFRASDRTQNGMVAIKILMILLFAAIGLLLGSHQWPSWSPPAASDGFPIEAFFASQYWIAFAMTGWNAAIYAASEFREPRRDVPRAMMIGCVGVGVVYLVINWIFVANLEPENARVVFDYDETRITLGHAIMEKLAGPSGGAAMSLLIIFAFLAAISAMTLVGPRVYAEMAADGYLPSSLAAKEGKPPALSILLQSALAVGLLWTHTILEAIASVGALLMASSALTCLAVFVVHRRADLPLVSLGSRVAAAVYALAMAWCLYSGRTIFGEQIAWMAGLILLLAIAFVMRQQSRAFTEKA